MLNQGSICRLVSLLLVTTLCLLVPTSCSEPVGTGDDAGSLQTISERLAFAVDTYDELKQTGETQEYPDDDYRSYPNGNRTPGVDTYLYDCWEYEIHDGSVRLIICWGQSKTEITIPEEINGRPVTTIGNMAFYYAKRLESIHIPSSVTCIEDGAFYKSYSLKEITIPASVSFIGKSSFFRTISLTAIWVDPENQFYSDIDGVLYNKDQTDLLIYPEAKASETYTLPDTVENVGHLVFGYANRFLVEIVIPSSVANLEDNPFYRCECLKAIHVDSDNTVYSDLDGVLFSKDQTEILAFPVANDMVYYTVPATVRAIGKFAFGWPSSSLKELTVLSNVVDISEYSPICNTTTLIVEPGSTAEQYAIDHNIKYRLTR